MGLDVARIKPFEEPRQFADGEGHRGLVGLSRPPEALPFQASIPQPKAVVVPE